MLDASADLPAPAPDWLAAPVLEHGRVRLRPLLDPDAAALSAGADAGTVAYLGSGNPEAGDLAAWTAHLRALNATPDRVNWAVEVGGAVMGRISLLDVRPDDRRVELGTMLLPAAQGTGVNASSKLLLMTRAFEVLGANRVQFKVDSRNARSLRALEKLGAVREGTLRQYQVRPDGLARDSVMFSVLRGEWPEVRARLLAGS